MAFYVTCILNQSMTYFWNITVCMDIFQNIQIKWLAKYLFHFDDPWREDQKLVHELRIAKELWRMVPAASKETSEDSKHSNSMLNVISVPIYQVLFKSKDIPWNKKWYGKKSVLWTFKFPRVDLKITSNDTAVTRPLVDAT